MAEYQDFVENVENLTREEEEKEAGGGLKSVRKRKVPSWRSENEAVWEEDKEENENEKKETPLVRKRKFYSQRKKTFSPEEKGVRMLQTPVSGSNKHKVEWIEQTQTQKACPHKCVTKSFSRH